MLNSELRESSEYSNNVSGIESLAVGGIVMSELSKEGNVEVEVSSDVFVMERVKESKVLLRVSKADVVLERLHVEVFAVLDVLIGETEDGSETIQDASGV